MRPNPFLVERQPLAKVRGKILRADRPEHRCAETDSDRAFRGIMNRIETADLIVEGARYLAEKPPKFFGSAILIFRRDANTKDPSSADKLSVLADSRLKRLIEDRLFTEILRHLGREATSSFDWQAREVQQHGEHRVLIDFETTLAVVSRPSEKVSF